MLIQLNFVKISFLLVDKMTLKKFLKPEWRKIVIFVILLLVTNFFLKGLRDIFTSTNLSYGPWDRIGYPFIFLYEIRHFLGEPINNPYASKWFPLGTIIIQESSTQILGLSLPLFLLDIIIFYLLSCFIIWIYDKFRKK